MQSQRTRPSTLRSGSAPRGETRNVAFAQGGLTMNNVHLVINSPFEKLYAEKVRGMDFSKARLIRSTGTIAIICVRLYPISPGADSSHLANQ